MAGLYLEALAWRAQSQQFWTDRLERCTTSLTPTLHADATGLRTEEDRALERLRQCIVDLETGTPPAVLQEVFEAMIPASLRVENGLAFHPVSLLHPKHVAVATHAIPAASTTLTKDTEAHARLSTAVWQPIVVDGDLRLVLPRRGTSDQDATAPTEMPCRVLLRQSDALQLQYAENGSLHNLGGISPHFPVLALFNSVECTVSDDVRALRDVCILPVASPCLPSPERRMAPMGSLGDPQRCHFVECSGHCISAPQRIVVPGLAIRLEHIAGAC